MIDGYSDATALAAALRGGELSAGEALDAAIARAEAVNGELNFLSDKLYDRAREAARRPLGDGPFAGVPYLIKDMHPVAGAVSGFGSKCALHAIPAPHNSGYVQALYDAGLNVFGLTTLGEFGYLPTTESVRYGATRNPWNLDYTPGGSSGGSGAAVAAGVVAMSDAADGGGSIRIPAANCGLFGLKPSRDRNRGPYPTASGVSLVEMNPLSWTVRDTARLMAATERSGADRVYPPVSEIIGPDPQRLRIGFHLKGLRGHLPHPDVSRAVDQTVRLLEDLGHHVDPTDWPFDGRNFMAAFGAVWVKSAGATNDLIAAAVPGGKLEGVLEPYTITLGSLAAAISDADVAAARGHLVEASARYFAWFDQFDVIVSPVLLTPPPKIGHINGTLPFAEVSERTERNADFTMVQNATGGPAMSVPLGMSSDGLPIGVHFAAPLGAEARLLALAFELEQAAPWIDRRPPLWAPDRIAADA